MKEDGSKIKKGNVKKGKSKGWEKEKRKIGRGEEWAREENRKSESKGMGVRGNECRKTKEGKKEEKIRRKELSKRRKEKEKRGRKKRKKKRK